MAFIALSFELFLATPIEGALLYMHSTDVTDSDGFYGLDPLFCEV